MAPSQFLKSRISWGKGSIKATSFIRHLQLDNRTAPNAVSLRLGYHIPHAVRPHPRALFIILSMQMESGCETSRADDYPHFVREVATTKRCKIPNPRDP